MSSVTTPIRHKHVQGSRNAHIVSSVIHAVEAGYDAPRPYFENARLDAVRVTIEPPTAASSGMRELGSDLSLCRETAK